MQTSKSRHIAILSFHSCPLAPLGEKDIGGMNSYLLQVARGLGRRGHLVDVFTRHHDPKDPEIVELDTGVRIIHLRAGSYDLQKKELHRHSLEFLNNLRWHQQNDRRTYDIIHSHYWLSGKVGMMLSKAWMVPHITSFHTLAKTKLRARVGEKESDLRLSDEHLIIRSADGIVTLAESEKQDMIRLYGAKRNRIKVIPPGVDLKLFAPRDKRIARRKLNLGNGKLVLFAGRAEPIKGLDILVEAIANLEENSGANLVVVGGTVGHDSELERIQSMAKRFGIDEDVTFVGSVTQPILADYYNAADIFVLPSYYESFGLAALEAMACGTPVIASRVGGIPSFLEHGKTGYLIPWRCPEPFSQTLDLLLTNNSLRQSMGRQARSKALTMDWDAVCSGVEDYYEEVIGQTWERAQGA